MTTFHIIDAVFLRGEDLRAIDFKARNEMCRVFAKAMSKNNMPGFVTIRSKEIFGLEYLEDILQNLQMRLLKSSGGRSRVTYDVMNQDQVQGPTNSASYFCPTGVLLQKIVREPFMMAKSKSQNRKYWYNFQTRQSVFECPKEALIDFQSAFTSR